MKLSRPPFRKCVISALRPACTDHDATVTPSQLVRDLGILAATPMLTMTPPCAPLSSCVISASYMPHPRTDHDAAITRSQGVRYLGFLTAISIH
jgi:hypothetical protein